MGSLLKKMLGLALAGALLAASIAPASAGHRGRDAAVAAGVVAGIVGLGLLGAAAEEERYRAGAYCEPGPLECRIFERPCFYNSYGDYICPAPQRRCFRRQYCD